MEAIAVKERPILFSGPMVRALLAGKKTQTRRIVKPQPHKDQIEPQYPAIELVNGDPIEVNAVRFWEYAGDATNYSNLVYSPYGRVGERLWVRETWSPDHAAFYPNFPVVYAADCPMDVENGHVWSPEAKNHFPFRWRPSIHMPRRLSRIALELTEVRVQRLQEISEEDAIAEGIIKLPASGRFVITPGAQYFGNSYHSARMAYAALWDSINGTGSWHSNPSWVWALTFKVL